MTAATCWWWIRWPAPASRATSPGSGGATRSAITAEIADIRDPYVINHLVHDASAIVHLAAQVAVTTSLADPMADFEVNALGTMHLLEALRKTAAPPPTLFASTNKVYGKLDGVELVQHDGRYLPRDPGAARQRHWRAPAARPAEPLRLLQGRRRPVRARLRALLSACRPPCCA